jgi:hypothetical protein
LLLTFSKKENIYFIFLPLSFAFLVICEFL